MRALLIISGLLASTSFAQSGTWGGYVTGWQRDPPRLGTNFTYGYIGDTQLEPSVVTHPWVPTVYGWPAALSYQTDEDVERQQEAARAAQQRVLDQQQAEYERQQERARAQEAELLAQQQQLALEQEILAQRQQAALLEEQARLAARELEAKQAELEQKERAEEEAAKARAEEEAAPREEGPDIHRWVDEEGVVHYSTEPRR